MVSKKNHIKINNFIFEKCKFFCAMSNNECYSINIIIPTTRQPRQSLADSRPNSQKFFSDTFAGEIVTIRRRRRPHDVISYIIITTAVHRHTRQSVSKNTRLSEAITGGAHEGPSRDRRVDGNIRVLDTLEFRLHPPPPASTDGIEARRRRRRKSSSRR